jgi:hypothetical protein
MEPLYSSPSEAKLKEFEAKGYKKFTQPTPPNYCIPNKRECNFNIDKFYFYFKNYLLTKT